MKHILTSAVRRVLAMTGNSTVEGYLQKMAHQYLVPPVNQRRDCRGYAVKHLVEDPVGTHHYIVIVGQDGVCMHVLLTDAQGRKTYDAAAGTLHGDSYLIRINGEMTTLQVLRREPVDHFLTHYVHRK